MKSKIALPPIREQQKIAAILTTQDKVIELKEKRLAEKQRQKNISCSSFWPAKSVFRAVVESGKM